MLKPSLFLFFFVYVYIISFNYKCAYWHTRCIHFFSRKYKDYLCKYVDYYIVVFWSSTLITTFMEKQYSWFLKIMSSGGIYEYKNVKSLIKRFEVRLGNRSKQILTLVNFLTDSLYFHLITLSSFSYTRISVTLL